MLRGIVQQHGVQTAFAFPSKLMCSPPSIHSLLHPQIRWLHFFTRCSFQAVSSERTDLTQLHIFHAPQNTASLKPWLSAEAECQQTLLRQPGDLVGEEFT